MSDKTTGIQKNMVHNPNGHPLVKTASQIMTKIYTLISAFLFVFIGFVKGEYFSAFGGLMAKVLYGEMISDLRGKINGTVHARNRGGAYMRTKVTPVNPNSPAQSAVRNRLTGRAQAWRGLTQLQRDAWNSAVSNFQKTNIFGQLRTPSGINLYNRLNINLVNIGIAVITEPPLPESIESITSLSVVADDSANSVIVTFGPAITPVSKIIIEATEPLSAGVSFAKSQFRQIGVITSADVSPFDASALYAGKFGSTPVAGSKIFVRVTVVAVASGLTGIPLQTSTITVA